SAERVAVAVAGRRAAAAGPFAMPEITLPLPLIVEDLHIGSLELPGEPPVVLTGIHFSGALRDSALTVRELRAVAGDFAVRLAGSAELMPGLPLDARVEWRLRGATPVSGAGTVRGDLALLAIEQSLRVPEAIRVEASVRDIVATPAITARAGWENLAIELPGLGRVRSSAGSAELEGGPAQWRATLSGAVVGDRFPVAQLHARAQGSGEEVGFEQISLAGAAGTVQASGGLSLGADARLQLQWSVANLDPAVLRPELRGRVSGQGSIDARLPGELRLTIDALQGQLMERPLAGSGTVVYRDDLVGFDDIRLRAGANRLEVNGSLGERLSGRFRLDAPELGLLYPAVAGNVTAEGTVAGTLARPVIDLAARGVGLTVDGNSAAQVGLTLRVDDEQRVQGQLAAHDLRAGEQQLGNLDAGLQGTLDDHRLQLRFGNGVLRAELATTGDWDGVTLTQRVEAARVALDTLGEWQLEGEPRVRLRAGFADVSPHCWTQAPTTLCLGAGEWSAARSSFAATLQELGLERLRPWLPESLALTGRAHGQVALEFAQGVLTGQASWVQEETRLSSVGDEEELTAGLDTVRLDLEFTPDEAQARITLAGEAGLRLSGEGRAEAPLGALSPVEGRLTAHLPDIALFVPLLADSAGLADVAGEVGLDIVVAGALGEPRITGSAQLSGGAAALTGIGVSIEDIEVDLRGDGGAALVLQGSARAGGPLEIAGEITPLAQGGPAGFIRFRGERLDAVRLTDRFVQASPDITLRLADGRLGVDGTVLIPKADIVVRELPQSAVSPSADTVVADRDTPAQPGPGTLILDGEIDVRFGDDVRLRGFGLDTRLAGGLKLSQSDSGEPQGFGVVRLVEGRIGAYGRSLDIERGTLGFAGPLDDPIVDLRASRQVEWEGRRVTAGILVRGPATRTQSRVFSDPAMSEADALSYMVSGRPLQSAGGDERSAIAGAALALGLQQTSPVTARVGSAVSLDE
ncbi:MAG: translocation/assembly module TamB domain-containing protein, partial [Gammaproteobacteria bacterium]|nr:translocation/assembly module TamB domain-containing protein [Gammaproteobacteria bacterium]